MARPFYFANLLNRSNFIIVTTLMKTSRILVTLLAGGALISCTQTQQQYGLGGAAAGAAAGAIIDGTDGMVKGAALGAAAGVGTAAYKENQQRQAGAYNTGGDYRAQSPVAPAAPSYKVATPTNRPGIVKSPYRPYAEVNVSALKSGDRARVPGSNDIFIVP
ncbi:hypothetical protein N8538_00045 [bacterium]|nr:hypothetical protein [bacterium]